MGINWKGADMNYTLRTFCTTCCSKEEYRIKGRNKTLLVPMPHSYEELYAVCKRCGSEVYSGLVNDRNVYARHKALYKELESLKEEDE